MGIDKSFRDPALTKRAAQKIQEESRKLPPVRICHVCGTHEWTITHYGLRSLLPDTVEVIAGPGCPVCIVPASEIDEAVELALKGVVVTCFGDVLRVPGSSKSLLNAKAEGADVRTVYSLSDAVEMARREKKKDFAFFAVGFETTSPSTAVELTAAPPRNLSYLISHRTIPPAMRMLCDTKDLGLNGFIAPGHVSTIIGLRPYEVFPKIYGMPVVVAGFEPLDVMFAVHTILKQLSAKRPRLENEYTRAVTRQGNTKAQELIRSVFDTTDGNWRGLGVILKSKNTLAEKYSMFDAHIKHDIVAKNGRDLIPGCQCHLVVIGKIKPIQCRLYMKKCTPQTPVGPCMVGIEGTCRIRASATRPPE